MAEGLTQMVVTGTSTHKVGEVAQTLMGVTPSGSRVSRLNHTLTEQFEAWRCRTLQGHWRVLYLDGISLEVRHADQVDPTIILAAMRVDLEGTKDILAIRACAQESQDGWICVLQDLRTRGITEVDLIVTDGHEGLLTAVSVLFTSTPPQRCLVHKQPSADECHSQTGTRTHRSRMSRHLEPTHQRASRDRIGSLQRQVP